MKKELNIIVRKNKYDKSEIINVDVNDLLEFIIDYLSCEASTFELEEVFHTVKRRRDLEKLKYFADQIIKEKCLFSDEQQDSLVNIIEKGIEQKEREDRK